MSAPCEKCGGTWETGRRATALVWPKSGTVRTLCSPCSSPLCELCGIQPAAFSCGRGSSGNYHVCEACLGEPEVRRKKARPLRRQA